MEPIISKAEDWRNFIEDYAPQTVHIISENRNWKQLYS